MGWFYFFSTIHTLEERSKDGLISPSSRYDSGTFLQYFNCFSLVLGPVRFPEQYSIFSLARPQDEYRLLFASFYISKFKLKTWKLMTHSDNLCGYTSRRAIQSNTQEFESTYTISFGGWLYLPVCSTPCCVLFLSNSCHAVPRERAAWLVLKYP